MGTQPSLGALQGYPAQPGGSKWLESQSEACVATATLELSCNNKEPTDGPNANRLLQAPSLPMYCLGTATTLLPNQHRDPWFVRHEGVYLILPCCQMTCWLLVRLLMYKCVNNIVPTRGGDFYI